MDTLLLLIVVGVPSSVLGAICAVGCQRTLTPYLWTFVTASLSGSMVFLAWAALSVAWSTYAAGGTLQRAVYAGQAAACLYSFGAPFFGGGPSLVVGMATQYLLQVRCRRYPPRQAKR